MSDSQPENPIPVDTVDAPHEPAVRAPSSARLWMVVLAGPVVWITHFIVVYLAAEVVCEAERQPTTDFPGSGALEIFVVVVTLVAAASSFAAAAHAWRLATGPDPSPLHRVGAAMGVGAGVFVLAVGLPILVLEPCLR